MTSRRRTTGSRRMRLCVYLVCVGVVAGGVWGLMVANRPVKPSLVGLTLVSARRAELNSSLRASGTAESENSTLIDCKLERLEMRSEGRATMSSGASTILWVIDDGSYVKKGDLLCSLDSSEYEELVRQQEIKVDRGRADLQKAKLDLETSQLGVIEFKNGLYAQTIQTYEGKLKFAESDKVRAQDRLAWTERMRTKGYASRDQLVSDQQTLRRCEHEITKASWNLNLFKKYGAPLELRTLEAQVGSAKAELVSTQMRYDRFSERLTHYKTMVENCTVKAPHDGYLIYANTKSYFSVTSKIEAGSQVRQLQPLFYLPDLSKMKLITPLHESVLTRVKPGMRVRARIEGLSNRELYGKVVKIDPLPDTGANWLSDTKFFNATIHLDNAPRGIRPQMTAEVEIDLNRRPDVLSIPPEAMAVEEGRDFCYVASSEGFLERREIKLGQSTIDLLEVTDGLDEGEQVVSDVSHIDDYAALVIEPQSKTNRHEVALIPAETGKSGL